MKLKGLYHIASIGFVDQHLDRIDNTELCLKLMWQNYNEEPDPYKKFQMLKDIILVQPYLSYYEATKLNTHQYFYAYLWDPLIKKLRKKYIGKHLPYPFSFDITINE